MLPDRLVVVLQLWSHGCGCPTAYSLDFRVRWRALPCARVVWSMEQFLLQKGAGFLSIMVLRVLGPSRTPTVAFETPETSPSGRLCERWSLSQLANCAARHRLHASMMLSLIHI